MKRLGRYDVLGTIGHGGMGTVYDAIEREHGARVALKTLTNLDPASLVRFKNEFRSVADLSHPNLVPVYELGVEGDLWFFTMDRLDGVDLLTWLRGTQTDTAGVGVSAPSAPTLHEIREALPMFEPPTPAPAPSIPKLREAFAQLYRGVHALHQAGLLHLDLKPSNVLVTRDGRVVVLDFGLVRPIGSKGVWMTPGKLEGSISGTPAWMAPEQFSGERVGEPADWYAVGLMLYQALTGVPACPLGDPTAIAYARTYLPVVPPHEVVRDVPEDLSALAVSLLASDPDTRPTGAQLVGEAPPPEPVRPTLIGRDTERAWLAAALGEATSGRAAIVHVTGPSGVGKSALVRALGDDARARGALVLRGRCYERESVPYNGFDGLVDELAAHLAATEISLPAWFPELARVFPVLASLDDTPVAAAITAPEVRRRATIALRELIGRLAARQPLVIAIDDLQWADADSAALLDQLIAAPMAGGLVLATTHRPEEAADNWPIARHLADARADAGRSDRRCLELALAPLAPADAARLAAASGAPPELAAAIAAEAGGVPFFVEELARQAEHGTGISLDAAVARRIAALPAHERALVETLAVASAPVPVAAAFAAAGLTGGALRAMWSLRERSLIRATGVRATDRVELQHDRVREVTLGGLAPERRDALHLALGRALLAHDRDARLFEAVGHLASAQALLDDRRAVARLELEAGRRARRAAAFPLAFACLHAGTVLLDDAAWTDDYELALALHGEAAEAAFLANDWAALATHAATVKAHGKTILDRLIAVEAEIDGHIARTEYGPALDAALAALRELGVALPGDPGEAEVGAAVQATMASLAQVGPEGLAALPIADDPTAAAAMRMQGRICSAAYFARPMLLPVLAGRMLQTSVERGVAPGTAYALAIHGIVLNTIGLYRDAHAWGRVALALLDRFPDDRSLEVRTRHVVGDLVGVWTVPLAETLAPLRRVFDLGAETGDLEYAGYAAHGCVHNALYAARPLALVTEEAAELGAFMRAHQLGNALHVSIPFERLIACFTGSAADPATLDGDGFSEDEALAAARATGSRSAMALMPILMGIARYHAGKLAEASACFEQARPYLDGLASIWHVPIFHQYSALAIHALGRTELAAEADASLAYLRKLASDASEVNFGHRVALVEAARDRSASRIADAIAGAEAGGWLNDLALAHEVAFAITGDTAHRDAARDAYTRWGARACAARLSQIG